MSLSFACGFCSVCSLFIVRSLSLPFVFILFVILSVSHCLINVYIFFSFSPIVRSQHHFCVFVCVFVIRLVFLLVHVVGSGNSKNDNSLVGSSVGERPYETETSTHWGLFVRVCECVQVGLKIGIE